MKMRHFAVAVGTACGSINNVVDSAAAGARRHQASNVTRQEHRHQGGLTSIGNDQYTGGASGLARSKQPAFTMISLGSADNDGHHQSQPAASSTCPLDRLAA